MSYRSLEKMRTLDRLDTSGIGGQRARAVDEGRHQCWLLVTGKRGDLATRTRAAAVDQLE